MNLIVALAAACVLQDPAEPRLKLLNFRGGETCFAGRGRIIALETTANPADVAVQVSSDAGATWSEVPKASLAPVKGGLLWRPLPREAGKNYRLRVSFKVPGGAELADQSAGDFAIEPAPAAPAPSPVAFTMKLPPAVKGGSTLEVSWECREVTGTVSIFLLADGARDLIARDQPLAGVVRWDVPAPDRKNCRLLLEVDGRTALSPPFEVDSTPPEVRDADVEIPGK